MGLSMSSLITAHFFLPLFFFSPLLEKEIVSIHPCKASHAPSSLKQSWQSLNSSSAPNAHSSQRQLKHDITLDKTESISEQRFTTAYTDTVAHFLKPYIHRYIVHSFTLCGAKTQNQSMICNQTHSSLLCAPSPPGSPQQTAQQPSRLLEEMKLNWEVTRQNIRTGCCNFSLIGKVSKRGSESGRPVKTQIVSSFSVVRTK